MSFQDLTKAAQEYFPDLKIKYKDQSWFMKLLGKLLFFNKSFMTSYTTTIGSTIYFPTESFVTLRPISSMVVMLHELVHIKDSYKISKPLFGFLYLTPQILSLLCIPLLFISWKIFLPLMILFGAPIPSFFRMYFEKRAYLSSLYKMYALGNKLNFEPKLDEQSKFFSKQFKSSAYYWMWSFGSIDNQLNNGIVNIKAGKRPFEDPIFDILDKLISVS
jgi:hypothetical protein